MHASITSHIVQKYLIDEAAGIWGPNLQLFQERLGNHEVKERTENLYFAYLFVLRAVMKAGPYLESTSFHTGCPQDDKRTCELVKQLVRSGLYSASCCLKGRFGCYKSSCSACQYVFCRSNRI